jgi:hypothetical protein
VGFAALNPPYKLVGTNVTSLRPFRDWRKFAPSEATLRKQLRPDAPMFPT